MHRHSTRSYPLNLQNSGDASGLRKLLCFLGEGSWRAFSLYVMSWKPNGSIPLQYRLGREEMIAVSRHPILAAFPFNVGHRISFGQSPSRRDTYHRQIWRSYGTTASGPGESSPLTCSSPLTYV